MSLVPLVLDLFDGALNPVVAGTATLTPSVQLTDPGTGIAVTSGPAVVFRASNPTPLTWILPTDVSGWAPSGWGWNIAFSSSFPGSPAAYSFKITSSGYSYDFTSTEASPAVFTASGSSLTDGTAVALAPGSAPGGFRSNVAYYVVDAGGDTFSLAATAGGSAIAATSAGSGSLGVVQYLSSFSPESDVTTSAAYAQVNAGDLDGSGGSSADPKVSGIQGVPVSDTSPSEDQVLTYNGSEWVPETPAVSGGTVTSVSVEDANGFTGTVADDTSTPQITLGLDSITGVLKGTGTAISEATAGTDYLAPDGDGSGLTGITASQAGALPSAGGTLTGDVTQDGTGQYSADAAGGPQMRLGQKANGEAVWSWNVDQNNGDAIDDASLPAWKFSIEGGPDYNGAEFQSSPSGTWDGTAVFNLDEDGNVAIAGELTADGGISSAGQADGLATLDGTGNVPLDQLANAGSVAGAIGTLTTSNAGEQTLTVTENDYTVMTWEQAQSAQGVSLSAADGTVTALTAGAYAFRLDLTIKRTGTGLEFACGFFVNGSEVTEVIGGYGLTITNTQYHFSGGFAAVLDAGDVVTVQVTLTDASGTLVVTNAQLTVTAGFSGETTVVLDDDASDIQAVGTSAGAGSTGKAADAGHVHPGFDSPALTGIPTAPTAASGTDSTQIATTAFAASLVAGTQVVVPSGDETGSDDVTALQSALTAARTAGGGVVKGQPGGSFYLNAPIRAGSNTTLDMTDCTVTLVESSACNSVQNWAVQANRTILDGVTTGSSATFTSETADFTSDDVGATIQVFYEDGTYLATTISAYSSSTSVTLATEATQSGTALYAAIGAGRDSNVTVTGGNWLRLADNYAPNLSAWDSNNIRIRHCDGIKVGPLQTTTIAGKYAVNIGDCTSFWVHDITSDAAVSDSVHVNGPASWGRIERITATAPGDDVVALTGGDYYGDSGTQCCGDCMGYITDVSVRTVISGAPATSNPRAVLLLGGQSAASVPYLIDRIDARDIRSQMLVYPVWIGVDDTTSYTEGGSWGRILIDGAVNHAVTPPGACVYIQSGATVSDLEIRSVIDEGASTSVWVQSGATITRLLIYGVENGQISKQGTVTTYERILPSPTSSAPLNQASGGTGVSEASDSALLAALGAAAVAGTTFTGYLAPAVAALTFGSSIAVNAALGNAFSLTLTASTGTLANPTNPVDGQVIRFRITQGTGGSFTLAYGSAYDFGAAGAPTLSTTAGDVDILGFEYVASISKWCYLGAALGN